MVLKIKSENKWSRMNVGRQFRTHFLVFLKMTIIAIHKFGAKGLEIQISIAVCKKEKKHWGWTIYLEQGILNPYFC